MRCRAARGAAAVPLSPLCSAPASYFSHSASSSSTLSAPTSPADNINTACCLCSGNLYRTACLTGHFTSEYGTLEDGYCEKEIHNRIAMGKKIFMDKKRLFTGKL